MDISGPGLIINGIEKVKIETHARNIINTKHLLRTQSAQGFRKPFTFQIFQIFFKYLRAQTLTAYR